MNAFEDIVKLYLEEEGYWVRQSVKVNKITREDKRKLNNYSMPTPEIDIVAYKAKENELLLVEVSLFLTLKVFILEIRLLVSLIQIHGLQSVTDCLPTINFKKL